MNKYRTLSLFDSKMTENLIFYLVKANAYCPDLVNKILALISEKGWIQSGQIKDHMSLI